MNNNLRHLRRALLFATALVLLSACASLESGRTITLSDADLTRLLEQHGPFQRRLLEVLDVRIDHPTVKLKPFSNRLVSDLNLSTTERMSGKTYRGHLVVEYGLHYDDTLKAIRMNDVDVSTLDIEGLPSPKQTGLDRLGALIAEQLLDGAVVYRFKPSDLRDAKGQGLKPSGVDVTSRGVEIHLSTLSD